MAALIFVAFTWSGGGEAVVDEEMRAVDEARIVAGQEERARATSSGSQMRPCCAASAASETSTPSFCSSATSRRPCGVLTKPGQTALQRMLRSRNSTAMARANMWQAPLVVS